MTGDPMWGRVQRGIVWHVLTPAYRAARFPDRQVDVANASSPATWCGVAVSTLIHLYGMEGAIVEETDLRPPRGARPCRKCCAAVAEFARLVEVAEVTAAASPRLAAAALPDLESGLGRPVEDVDLLASLPGGEG